MKLKTVMYWISMALIFIFLAIFKFGSTDLKSVLSPILAILILVSSTWTLGLMLSEYSKEAKKDADNKQK